MTRELMKLLTHVITAKRDLKQVYYTTRSKDFKLDVKELVTSTIGVQRLLDEIIDLTRKRRIAKKILEDKKAGLMISKWSMGLPKRVKDFIDKTKQLEFQHLNKFAESLLQYIKSIGHELAKWIEDIKTLAEIPKPPHE